MHVQSCCFAHKTIFFDVVVQEKSNAWEGSGGGGEGVRDGHVCIYSKQ